MQKSNHGRVVWEPAETRIIERRAAAIRDPIERLRYLRHASVSDPPRSRAPARLALVVLCVLIMQSGSGIGGRLREAPRALRPAPSLRRARAEVVDASMPPPATWLVDQTKESEVYSNGLRIEREFEIANKPRSYSLIDRASLEETGPLQSQPAGIVFHITESDQAPFEARQNRALNRLGRDLLAYVRGRRAYHFVIDRFGRVFRVVLESDAANHAGYSIWADSRWAYLNLNNSFLGVAFEARTEANDPPVDEAQLNAARTLVAVLRDKYRIAAANCVTHAQVSVNPDNLRIGFHTDWGAGFPFQKLDLPDNYQSPSPAVALFGFEHDDSYRESTCPRLWHGLSTAEEQIRDSAAHNGLTLTQYRILLQKRYRQVLSVLRERTETQEQ